MLTSVKIPVTTTGANGAATGNASSRPVSGEVLALYVDWDANAPATSDITVTFDSDDDHPAVTIYAKTDNKTDAWVYPNVLGTDAAGANLTGWYQHPVGSGPIKVAVAQCDALAPAVTVYAWLRE